MKKGGYCEPAGCDLATCFLEMKDPLASRPMAGLTGGEAGVEGEGTRIPEEAWRCRVAFLRSKYSLWPSSEGLTKPVSAGWPRARCRWWWECMAAMGAGVELKKEDDERRRVG